LLAWGRFGSTSFGEPVVLLVQLNVQGKWKKVATACTVWTERIQSMYIRMRVLPWSNTLLARGRFGSISAPFGEPVVLLVQLNVQENGRR
jgi:hypothetical protein